MTDAPRVTAESLRQAFISEEPQFDDDGIDDDGGKVNAETGLLGKYSWIRQHPLGHQVLSLDGEIKLDALAAWINAEKRAEYLRGLKDAEMLAEEFVGTALIIAIHKLAEKEGG